MPGENIEIEGYEIIRQIARGGMAIVYLGREIALDREVAIKVMDTNLEVLGEDLVARFRREAQITASTSHPNIVSLHSFGLVQGRPYITMEYLKGGTLRQRLKKAQTLSVDAVLTLGNQVASALEVLHGRGVVHRDLKPDNVLFHEIGHAVLTDFGIAKLFEANTQLTSAGMTLGTYGYISPEQAVGEAIDGRSDIYSLGVILYEALVGSLPTRAESTAAFLYALVHSTVSSLPEEYTGLQPLFDRALARAPEDRFADITEFRLAIEEASRSLMLGKLDVNAAAPAVTAPAAEMIEEATNIVPTPVPQELPSPAPEATHSDETAEDLIARLAAKESEAPEELEESAEPEETTVRNDPELLAASTEEAAEEEAEETTVRTDPELPEEATIRVGDGSTDAAAAEPDAAAAPDEPFQKRYEPILSEARPSPSRSSRQMRIRRNTATSERARSTGTYRATNATKSAAPVPLIAGGSLAALALLAGISWWVMSGQESNDDSTREETVANAVADAGMEAVADAATAPLAAPLSSEAIADAAPAPDADRIDASSEPVETPLDEAGASAAGPAAVADSRPAMSVKRESANPDPAPQPQEPLLNAQLANELSELLRPPVTTDELVQALEALSAAGEPAAAFNLSAVAQPLRDQVNLFVRTQLRERAYLGLGPVLYRLQGLEALGLMSADSQQRLDSHLGNLAAEAALQFRLGYLSAPEDNNLLLTLNNIFSIDPAHGAALELKQQSAERLAGIASEAWLAGTGDLATNDTLSSAAIEYMGQALEFHPDAPDAPLWKTMLENWQTTMPAVGTQSGNNSQQSESTQTGSEPDV
ncbi:MAG: serine/threonine-protein kinase [Pseudomonadota bacterium]